MEKMCDFTEEKYNDFTRPRRPTPAADRIYGMRTMLDTIYYYYYHYHYYFCRRSDDTIARHDERAYMYSLTAGDDDDDARVCVCVSSSGLQSTYMYLYIPGDPLYVRQ